MPANATRPAVYLLPLSLLLVLLPACSMTDGLFRETHRSESSVYIAPGLDQPGVTNEVANAAKPADQTLAAMDEEQVTTVPASGDLSTLPPQGKLYIQVAAFSSPDNAKKLRDQLAKAQSYPVEVYQETTENGTFYKVQFGPFASVKEADAAEHTIRAAANTDKISYVRR